VIKRYVAELFKKAIGNLWAGKLWSLYPEVVHNALFIELIAHEVPQGTVLGLVQFVEEHEKLVIVGLAVLVSCFRKRRESEPPREQQKKSSRRRPKRSQGDNEHDSTTPGDS
jgi:hypothetical protein